MNRPKAALLARSLRCCGGLHRVRMYLCQRKIAKDKLQITTMLIQQGGNSRCDLPAWRTLVISKLHQGKRSLRVPKPICVKANDRCHRRIDLFGGWHGLRVRRAPAAVDENCQRETCGTNSKHEGKRFICVAHGCLSADALRFSWTRQGFKVVYTLFIFIKFCFIFNPLYIRHFQAALPYAKFRNFQVNLSGMVRSGGRRGKFQREISAGVFCLFPAAGPGQAEDAKMERQSRRKEAHHSGSIHSCSCIRLRKV